MLPGGLEWLGLGPSWLGAVRETDMDDEFVHILVAFLKLLGDPLHL